MEKSNTCQIRREQKRTLVQSTALSVRLVAPVDPGRSLLEALVADKFAREYKARIRHFLPFLLSLDIAGAPAAVAGLRLARQSALYLEQYLDRPVEQAVSNEFRVPVDRDSIVEIGNLAAFSPGAAEILFGLLPSMLNDAGIHWVTCTATPRVMNILGKLDFPSRRICQADRALLADDSTDWGHYYSTHPAVIAGNSLPAAIRASEHPLLNDLQLKLGRSTCGVSARLRSGG